MTAKARRKSPARDVASSHIPPTFRSDLQTFRDSLPGLRDRLVQSINAPISQEAMDDLDRLGEAHMLDHLLTDYVPDPDVTTGHGKRKTTAHNVRDRIKYYKRWQKIYRLKLELLDCPSRDELAALADVHDLADPGFRDPLEDADNTARNFVAFSRAIKALEDNEADQPETNQAIQTFVQGLDTWAHQHAIPITVSKALPAAEQRGFEPVLLVVRVFPSGYQTTLADDRIRDFFIAARYTRMKFCQP